MGSLRSGGRVRRGGDALQSDFRLNGWVRTIPQRSYLVAPRFIQTLSTLRYLRWGSNL